MTPKNSRIVGGVQALAHSWPWQGSVRYRGNDWRHWCGCSVIAAHWAITAAHCMYCLRSVALHAHFTVHEAFHPPCRGEALRPPFLGWRRGVVLSGVRQ